MGAQKFMLKNRAFELGTNRMSPREVAVRVPKLSVSKHSVWDFGGLRNTTLCSEHRLVFKHKNWTCVQTQRLVFKHKAVCVAVCSLCLAACSVCLVVFRVSRLRGG